jgi:hypothetical protein
MDPRARGVRVLDLPVAQCFEIAVIMPGVPHRREARATSETATNARRPAFRCGSRPTMTVSRRGRA